MIKLINKRLKIHLQERDGDGFACCPIKNNFEMRVAGEKEWLGTKEGREEALKEQEKMDKYIYCDFCSLCAVLLNILNKW